MNVEPHIYKFDLGEGTLFAYVSDEQFFNIPFKAELHCAKYEDLDDYCLSLVATLEMDTLRAYKAAIGDLASLEPKQPVYAWGPTWSHGFYGDSGAEEDLAYFLYNRTKDRNFYAHWSEGGLNGGNTCHLDVEYNGGFTTETIKNLQQKFKYEYKKLK